MAELTVKEASEAYESSMRNVSPAGLLGGLVEAFAVGGATLATFLVAEPSAISGSHRIPHVSVARPGGGPFPDPKRPQGAKLGRGRPVTGPATGLPRILQTSSRRPQVRRQPARGSPNGVELASGEEHN